MHEQMTFYLNQIVEQNPLVNCLTNKVTTNFQANALLAIGASPIMTDEPDASPLVSAQSQAIVINIGSPFNQDKMEAIELSIKAANDKQIPVIIDPVGVAALSNRLAYIEHLLSEYEIAAVCGNYSEIAALAGAKSNGKGVDGGHPEGEITDHLLKVANLYQTVVVATGKTDYIANQTAVYAHQYGDALLGYVTGTGCVATTIVAAFISQAPTPADYLTAATLATGFYAWCGGRAVQLTTGPGDLPIHLLNQLYEHSVKANNKKTSDKELTNLTITQERMSSND